MPTPLPTSPPATPALRDTSIRAGVVLALALTFAIGLGGRVVSLSRAQPQESPAAPGTRTIAAADPATSSASPGTPVLRHLARLVIPGAEVGDYDPASNTILVTSEAGVTMVNLGTGANPSIIRNVDLAPAPSSSKSASITHVAADPAGRGFAAAAWNPSTGDTGSVVLFSIRTGEKLRTLTAGYGPDCLKFTPDGSRIAIVNEAEPFRDGAGRVVSDPPGSISVISLDGITSAEQLRTLPQSACLTVYPQGPTLATAFPSLSPSGDEPRIRIHPARLTNPWLDLEPEYVAISGNSAFISLQENNAVAEFDLRTNSWVRIAPLATLNTKIDASDKDGRTAVDRTIAALPMPDQLAACTINGTAYFVTANEGDDRGDADLKTPLSESTTLGDQARILEIARTIGLGGAAGETLDISERGYGRLRICAYSGDTDGDGRIDRPTLLGSRSISIWDPVTLRLIGDTGPAIEQAVLAAYPHLFNADSDASTKPDTRSDDRGCEPEGIAVTQVGGRTIAVVTLERPGLIALIDLSDPATPSVVSLFPAAESGDRAPEGVFVILTERSPSHSTLVVVCFEGSGTLCVYELK